MNIFKATLDTRHQNGVIGPITQFDNATLELQILSDGQVIEPWDSPEFELLAMKRDMNQVREVDQDKFTILSKEDHRVQIALKEQFLTCRGTVKMQLVVKDGGRTSTTIFYLSIAQSLDHTIVESIKDIKVLDDLDEVVESLGVLEVTATNNEEKRQENEQLRELAESNRQDEFDKAQNQRDVEFNEKMEEYREYVISLEGIQGPPGETLQIRVNETHIQVKYPSQQDWTDLIALEMLKGPQGLQGLQGLQGEQGTQGPAGKDGANGRDGVTPNITIGTVTTLEPGQEATVTIRGDKENPILDIAIPRGDKGDPGQSLILKDTLVTTPIIDSTLNLTTDKYQITTMQNNTTIALPNVNSFTEIHLFFNTTSELTLALPNIKWQTAPNIEANKVYEFIFTYANEWLGGWYATMPKKLLMNNILKPQADETIFAEYTFDNRIASNCLPTISIVGGYEVVDAVDGNITRRVLRNADKNAPTNISFNNRRGLLTVGYINVSNLDSIDSMFRDCMNLISVDGSGWDTSNIVRMGSFVTSCGSLMKLNISNWDTSRLERMGNFASSCTNLRELNISNWDISKVNYIQGAFSGCHNLSGEITIRNPNIMSYMGIFNGTSVNPNSKFTVKYIDEPTKAMAEKLVATKSQISNVVLADTPTN